MAGSIRSALRAAALLTLAAAAATPASARAQTTNTAQLNGRVVAGSQPVPDQPVTLHRVTETGGQTLATDTTDAQGRFTLAYQPLADAIHFAATRFEGQLYIGETFRDQPSGEYTVAVGPGATPINIGAPALQPLVPQPTDSDSKRTGIVIVLVVAFAAAGTIALARRLTTAAGRRLLVQIAELDNRHAAQPIGHYAEQRAELLRRLRESA